MRFTMDSQPEGSWPALRLGEPWNGWATPVVVREVLADMLVASGEPHQWEDEVAWLGTPAVELQPDVEPEFFDPIRPSEDGTYDLGQMGWTFREA